MSMPVFIAIAATFFIIGILCIIKGTSEEEEAVPISRPEEIEELKNAFSPPPQKETKSEQLNEGNAPISVSTAESGGSQSEIEEMTKKNKELEDNIETLKSENQKIKDSQAEQIKSLQEKIADAQKEKEQLVIDQHMLNELKVKGEIAERRHTESKVEQDELRKFIKTLESEMEDLVKSQKLGIDKSELDALSRRLESSIATIEALKGENKNLLGSNQTLKSEYEKAKEYSEHLLEKEKYMEFELSKNRAQVLGLEKICEDFKVQIENLTAAAIGK